jgi:hypothetical protein
MPLTCCLRAAVSSPAAAVFLYGAGAAGGIYSIERKYIHAIFMRFLKQKQLEKLMNIA